MGEVHPRGDSRLNRDVAMKTLPRGWRDLDNRGFSAANESP
jgi:hypothetical protein